MKQIAINQHLPMLITVITVLALTLLPGIFSGIAHATAEQDICDSIGGDWIGGECITPGPTAESAINDVVDILCMIVGIVSVVMIIIGGFKYVTSGGDPNAAKSARNTILYAIVGLIVVAVAQAIVWFVLQSTVATPPPATVSI